MTFSHRFLLISIVLIAILLCSGVKINSCFAQGYQLKIIIDENDKPLDYLKKVKPFSYEKIYSDSIKRHQALQEILVTSYEFGFIGASFDSISFKADKLAIAYLSIGKMYEWMRLSASESILNDAGFQNKDFSGKAVSPIRLSKLFNKTLQYSEENGYPFASIKIDSVKFNINKVTGHLHLEKGDLIIIDSIIVKGNSKLSLAYLYNYLSLRPGDIYNEEVISKISIRIKEIPFVKEIRPFNIVFNKQKARILLYIDEQNSNAIDGIIGFLPDEEDKGKLNLTGEASISLRNSFHQGEVLDLKWRQPRAKTQDLKIKANYPFLFSTAFGVEGRLHIYKQDTTFLETEQKLGLQYFLRGGNYLQVYYEGKESSLLSTKQFENATTLPEFADVSVTSYGLGYLSEKLDYRFNPTKGYSVEVSGTVGKKTIEKNRKLNSELYDSLDLKSNLYKIQLTFDYFFPLGRLHVLDFGVDGSVLIADDIFDNELYRFGGLKSLRGFDELSIRASQYGIWKVEYRYLLEQNSFMFLFVNGAYYRNESRNEKIEDSPIGFGAGINFETRLGIFSFNYALGKEFNNPFVFRTAKLHFGIVNYF